MPFPVELLRFFDRAATADADSVLAADGAPVPDATTRTDPKDRIRTTAPAVPEVPNVDPVPAQDRGEGNTPAPATR
jgi:hypothetical protein